MECMAARSLPIMLVLSRDLRSARSDFTVPLAVDWRLASPLDTRPQHELSAEPDQERGRSDGPGAHEGWTHGDPRFVRRSVRPPPTYSQTIVVDDQTTRSPRGY
jgi:hypothetical protein